MSTLKEQLLCVLTFSELHIAHNNSYNYCSKCRTNTYSIFAKLKCEHNYCIECAYKVYNKNKKCIICFKNIN